jgi:hypothetical protein
VSWQLIGTFGSGVVGSGKLAAAMVSAWGAWISAGSIGAEGVESVAIWPVIKLPIS